MDFAPFDIDALVVFPFWHQADTTFAALTDCFFPIPPDCTLLFEVDSFRINLRFRYHFPIVDGVDSCELHSAFPVVLGVDTFRFP